MLPGHCIIVDFPGHCIIVDFPKLYLRYIDDIFAIFDNDQSCTKFLEKLNTQHPNIKFTLEQAKNTIPFLDVEIKINLDKFDTWTWRKPGHLSIRAGEHLNVSRSSKSAIKEHIKKCSSCKTQANNMRQFEIIRKCQSSYEAKIHEALVIKRSSPVLNKQLYANGASFLVNVF